MLILAGSVIALRPVLIAGPHDWIQREAAATLESHSFGKARRLSSELLRDDSQSEFNNLLMAESLAGERESEAALEYYDNVTRGDPDLEIVTLYGKAARLFAVGRASDAEQFLKATLALDPHHFEACRKLAFLMRVQGRIWESTAPTREQIRQGVYCGDQLHMVGSRAIIVADEIFVAGCLRAVPDDPLPKLGEARLHMLMARHSQAEPLLNEVIHFDPNVLTAHACLGELLAEQERDTDFLEWHRNLPPNADSHPDIWYARGLYLVRNDRPAEAIRCFIETLVRSPNHLQATYQLSQSLQINAKTALARKVAQRAELLAQAELAVGELSIELTSVNMRRVSERMAELNRFWEAAAMCHIAILVMPEHQPWAESMIRTYIQSINDDDTFEPGIIPIAGVHPDAFPLPNWTEVNATKAEHDELSATTAEISFVDDADKAGLRFQYNNGSLKPDGLEHIFETLGGGVAVLDVDCDHWPDLWLAQGNALWTDAPGTAMTDQVFRNVDGVRYEAVTESCRVFEDSFTHGVTIGDIDSDGFPDAYVGNIGPNRLLLNNGDGTFTDVTEQAEVGGDEWTLSPAIVDLNQDGLPEIYSLNYLNLDEVRSRDCVTGNQRYTCPPTLFTAEQDRLYENQGDGRFGDVTNSCGIVRDGGKGLGLIAADFDGTGRISLFVGNDTSNNFLYQNHTMRGGKLNFTDEALLMGLACDGRGKAQATMGIAVDDCNGDGLLDLFTTNFYDDPNTLLQSTGLATWTDSTRSAHLFDSSIELLGFGSQFIDADLDGWPDLIVTNGHVDPSPTTGNPDRMRPQFYRNHFGRFDELTSPSLGEFFDGKYLGRALSTLDWNRDGRTDCCVSHLFTPTALLTNSTVSAGQVLQVRLIGVSVDRDAVGTAVTLEAGGRKWTKQLTFGNGYQSSNERLLSFGLGDISMIDRIFIHWCSGEITSMTNVAANVAVTVVQGSSTQTFESIPR